MYQETFYKTASPLENAEYHRISIEHDSASDLWVVKQSHGYWDEAEGKAKEVHQQLDTQGDPASETEARELFNVQCLHVVNNDFVYRFRRNYESGRNEYELVDPEKLKS